ncbi:tumor protein p53-inducible protein 11-like isoform X3 [Lineus longissimus]|uniref:tumor protein p53-inducible protein 11-like isoform X3 n=1 Tax=Lineus longissimus TaxID=88925 RepID=UPI00315CE0EF
MPVDIATIRKPGEPPPPSPKMTMDGPPPMNQKVAHMHKLERKHSSGDLHSRLKTRKLLGVGETDDGDVHRSKLSQILGHSENLYVKLPRGLRIWQVLVATMFSVVSLWALSFPSNLFNLTFETPEGGNAILPVRLYGAALLSLSIVFWSTVQSVDRDVIRWALMASIVYFVIQIVVTIITMIETHTCSAKAFSVELCRIPLGCISYYFYWAIGHKSFKVTKTAGNEKTGEGVSPSASPSPSASKSMTIPNVASEIKKIN